MKVHAKLTKVTTLPDARVGPNPIRTQEIIGFYENEPTLGRSFVFFGPPIDPKMAVRMFQTSAVTEICIEGENGKLVTVIKTMNSVYRLEGFIPS